MAFNSTWPRPAASATAAPDMPAKIRLATTLACPRPPGKKPTSRRAKLKSRLVMPAVFISLAARMNRGMARSRKLLTPYCIRWASMGMFTRLPISLK